MQWLKKMMGTKKSEMKVIFGLGNVGEKFQGTRHNVGWEVLEALKKEGEGEKKLMKKLQVEVWEGEMGGEKVVLVWPLTMMNLSGQAVNAVLKWFGMGAEKMLVICDDWNLQVGEIRLRAKGGAGGHNGLKSVIGVVGENFARLRIGVRPEKVEERIDPMRFVLKKFGREDEKVIKEKAVPEAVLRVKEWISKKA